MKNLPTVTIGIPALNEEQNIIELLNCLLSQKQTCFKLQEIIVVSDGSTDRTVELVKNLQNPLIRLIVGKTRIGQQIRQNQICKMFDSDILILIEADTLPTSQETIDELLKPFFSAQSENIGMVVGQAVTAPPTSFVEKIATHGNKIKDCMFNEWKNGDNIYNSGGHAMKALSRKFAKQIHWPTDVPEDSYAYFRLKELGFRFVKQVEAKALYRSVSTFSDNLKKNKKFLTGITALKEYFSADLVDQEYRPPKKLIIKWLALSFFKHPILTMFYLLQIYIKRLILFKSGKYTALYQPYTSTKNLNSFKIDNAKIKKVQNAYNSLASIYEKKAFYESEGLNYLNNCEKDFINKFIPNSENTEEVLDQGIGTGRITNILLEKGYKVYGLDFSLEMLAQTEKKYSSYIETKMLNLQQHDLHNRLPFPSNSFNGVVSVRVIKYIQNWTQLIHETARVLKNGGFYLLEVPNRASVQGISSLYNLHHTVQSKKIENELLKVGFIISKRAAGKKLPFFLYRRVPITFLPVLYWTESLLKKALKDFGSRNFIYYCVKAGDYKNS